LAGLHVPDPGATIALRDADGGWRPASEVPGSLHFIHQDLGLVDELTTVENLDIGRSYGARGLMPTSQRQEDAYARALLARFGVAFDVRRPLRELSRGERAIVAIARALDGWTRPDNVLVLDEPTAALHGDEVDRLLAAVRSVAERGAGVLFISHRLDEVRNLADRVVVLRDGRVVAELDGACSHEELVRLIAGSQPPRTTRERTRRDAVPAVSARSLAGGTVRSVDLDLVGGEIVGVSGILGSGREHLGSLIFGARRRTAGTVAVAGRTLAPGTPRAAIRAGVGFVPADRHAAGAVMSMRARENLTLPLLKPLRRASGAINQRAERCESERCLREVGLRPLEPERTMSLFSGGNQHKIVMAKWLRLRPRVLLLDEPTQGVDVGAVAAIHNLIVAAAADGAAVLVSSSDSNELVALCDRVLVLRDGCVAAQLQGASLTEAQLVREELGLDAAPAEETLSSVFGGGRDA
jgi:ribose transport system ATP-binding protein